MTPIKPMVPKYGQLEDDLAEPYHAFKTTPGPAANAGMLKALRPTIEGAIRTHVGEPNPVLTSRAKLLTLQGLGSYDPSRGRLKSHLYNQLLGLKRYNRQQTSILKVPERVALDRHHVETATKELTARLGFEPTTDQLADHTGFNPARIAKARSYNTGYSEGLFAETSEGNVYGSLRQPGQQQDSGWSEVVYDGLDDYHKNIMELALGLHGRRKLSNGDIARRMGRSDGAISQAKDRIQKLLDEEHELGGLA